jgi:hypothetical protein
MFAMCTLLAVHNNTVCQSPDSSNRKKTDTSITKYGTGKLALLGHIRKVALPALKDSDGDGVPDQLDHEPNTPPGAEVDSHGRAIDTDGDGVPDYRDKEKLTPQKCFPVDSNGVGKCRESGCCAEVKRKLDSLEKVIRAVPSNDSEIASLPSIMFKAGSSELTGGDIDSLNKVATQIQGHPFCAVECILTTPRNKKNQQIQVRRFSNIVKYLLEIKGLHEKQVSQQYHDATDHENVFDLISVPLSRVKLR